MKERPILFRGSMVRAILAGCKTVTRRIISPQPHGDTTHVQWNDVEKAFVPWKLGTGTPSSGRRTGDVISCRYGAKKDVLWVRERWRTWERPADMVDGILFDADNSFHRIDNTADAAQQWVEAHDNGRHAEKWRPSIFMPYRACRLKLTLSNITVERLQDITEGEALREGVMHSIPPPNDGHPITNWRCGFALGGDDGSCALYQTARDAFVEGFCEINGSDTWVANPWVWRLEFEVMR